MVGSDRSSMNINDAIFIIIVGEYIESIIIMNCWGVVDLNLYYIGPAYDYDSWSSNLVIQTSFAICKWINCGKFFQGRSFLPVWKGNTMSLGSGRSVTKTDEMMSVVGKNEQPCPCHCQTDLNDYVNLPKSRAYSLQCWISELLENMWECTFNKRDFSRMIDCTTYCITTSVFSDAQTGAEMGWNWDLQTQLPQVLLRIWYELWTLNGRIFLYLRRNGSGNRYDSEPRPRVIKHTRNQMNK